MNLNLNLFSGTVSAGFYDSIIINGNVSFMPGVEFATLTVRGTAILPECTGASVIMEGGQIECDADMSVHTITGNGIIEVGGNLACGTMQFTGDVTARNMRIETDLAVRGLVKTGEIHTDRAITVTGRVLARLIRANDLTLATLHTTMLKRFGMNQYSAHSGVDLIEAQTASLYATNCGKLTADKVYLRHGSYIAQVFYSNAVDFDDTSDVGSLRRTDQSGPVDNRALQA